MKKLLPLLTIFGVGIGFVIVYPQILGVCEVINGYYRNCLWGGEILESLGAGLIIFSGISFFFSLIFAFLSEKALPIWIKFSSVWVPISVLLVILAPESDGGLFGPSSKTLVTLLTVFLFTLISLILIALKSFRKPSK